MKSTYKKWRRNAKLFATSIIVATYLTIGLYSSAISKGKTREKEVLPTVKTIVGFSMEFRFREEMGTEEIRCGEAPEEDGESFGWRHDTHFGIYMFSAYYDVRLEPHRYVRVIALLPRNTSFYCQMWSGRQSTVRKAAVHEIWSRNWGGSCDEVYPALISCPVSELPPPERVSFVDGSCNGSNVSIRVSLPVPKRKEDFVVCVKPMNFTDHINDRSLIEWIELNFRFGAGKIQVYVSDLNTVDEDILREYKRRKLIETTTFHPISFPWCRSKNFEDHLWRKRKMEIIVYNDCFYRNYHDAKFVVPLDIDEMIVPKIGNNWYEAFARHFGGQPGYEYSSFSVRNVYFFAEYPKEAITLPNVFGRTKLVGALRRQRSRESIFERIIRSTDFSPGSDSSKSFLQVSRTLSVFNHYAFHVLGDAVSQYIFPETVFQLNHYRNRCDPLLIDGCHQFLHRVTLDDTLDKFRNRST